jgi:uncharacterized membrane protein
MGKRSHFFITMVLGGMIFLLPLVIISAVLGKAFQLMMLIAEPMDAWIPLDSVGDIAVVNVLAVLALLLSCFLAGLAARSSWGTTVYGSVDAKLQGLIPGYSAMRDKTASAISSERDRLIPVLVQFDDQSQIAFEVERADDGLVAIFLPGTPDPWSGSTVFVTSDRVAPIGTEIQAALRAFKNMGRGATAAIGEVRIQPAST